MALLGKSGSITSQLKQLGATNILNLGELLSVNVLFRLRQVQGNQKQGGHLRGKCLGGGNADLASGVGV